MTNFSYSTPEARKRPGWARLRSLACQRAGGVCEHCARALPLNGYFELHHRWYPERDTLANLMAVCRPCHQAIHKGGRIKIKKGSLASKRDTGNGNTKLWREYITNQQTNIT